MANTYYDSELTAEEIEEVLEAINGILNPANNGKVLAISNGKFEARSVQWGGGEPVLEPLNVIANGDYYPEAGVDGFDEVHVSVPNSYSASDEGKVVNNGALVAQTARASQITQNGTYDTTLNDEVTVNVSGSSAVVQPLSVTQNGTYNPPSGVDGYAPVTVNVSGGAANILSGTDDPTSSLGEDGAIYLRYAIDGYTPIEYIQSDGNQYVNLGYTPTLNTKVNLKINPQLVSESGILGSRWALNGFFLMLFQGKVRWHASGSVDSAAVAVNTDILIEADNASLAVNGTSYPVTPSTSLTGESLSVFYPTSAAGISPQPPKGQFKLYYLELRENDSVVRRYIPVKRNSDNTLGLYEIYTGTFYANVGTGVFVAGPEVSNTLINKSFLKVNGAWKELIGSDVNDVNTGGN